MLPFRSAAKRAAHFPTRHASTTCNDTRARFPFYKTRKGKRFPSPVPWVVPLGSLVLRFLVLCLFPPAAAPANCVLLPTPSLPSAGKPPEPFITCSHIVSYVHIEGAWSVSKNGKGKRGHFASLLALHHPLQICN